jgi:hypothetical protein
MAKIRSLGTLELRQVLTLLERFSADEFNYPVLERFQTLYMPIHMVNHYLPLLWKFLPEIYVAVSDGQVLGLVWLSRDGRRTQRWKIDQVIINPDAYLAYDVGKQLVYYVVNRLGAMGVETFLAYVDPHYSEGMALLKDCGFRHCTRLHTFILENIPDECRAEQPVNISGLRESRRSDARKLQELHSETLAPEARVSLRQSPADFYTPSGCRWPGGPVVGGFFKRWVVSTGHRDYLYGSLSLSSSDCQHFDAALLVSPSWEDGTADLLQFAIQQVAKSTMNPKITITAYEFQKNKIETLTQMGFNRVSTIDILVKDYWIPVKDPAILRQKHPVLLWAGRTSPA